MLTPRPGCEGIAIGRVYENETNTRLCQSRPQIPRPSVRGTRGMSLRHNILIGEIYLLHPLNNPPEVEVTQYEVIYRQHDRMACDVSVIYFAPDHRERWSGFCCRRDQAAQARRARLGWLLRQPLLRPFPAGAGASPTDDSDDVP